MRVDFDQAEKKPTGVRITGSGGPAATPRASGVKLSGRKQKPDEEPEEAEGLEEEPEEQADPDESGERSKLKAFLLIAAMVGGFALFVWNMTGLVNNMRLDNQGSAGRIVYEMEDLNGRMDEEPDEADEGEPSESQDAEEDPGGARDGPEDASGDAAGEEQAEDKPAAQEPVQYKSESEAIQAMKNDIALKDRELEQAAEMLDAALKREAELKKKLAEHGIE